MNRTLVAEHAHDAHRLPEEPGSKHDLVGGNGVDDRQFLERRLGWRSGSGQPPYLSPTAVPRPRAQACANIRLFPAGCTSLMRSASCPQAMMSSPVTLSTSPGLPLIPSITFGPNIFTSVLGVWVKAPGLGSQARIRREISIALSFQSIRDDSRVTFGT